MGDGSHVEGLGTIDEVSKEVRDSALEFESRRLRRRLKEGT